MFSSNRIFLQGCKRIFSKKELSFCQNLFFFHKFLLNKSMQYQGKENSSIFNVSLTFSIKVESGQKWQNQKSSTYILSCNRASQAGHDIHVLLQMQFSPTRPSGPSWSSSRDVRLLYLVSCPLFMYQILRPILPPLPKVACTKFLEIQNPWGKVLERRGLRIEYFCWEMV